MADSSGAQLADSEAAHFRGQSATSTESTPTPQREGSIESKQTNPFTDATPSQRQSNVFNTPSRPASLIGDAGATAAVRPAPARYFHSRRVKKGEIEQPWKNKKDPKEIWVTIIPIIGLLVGCGIAAFLVWEGINSVVHHKYCPIMSDDFSNGFNTDIWTKEAEVGGFGNGQFEQTTITDENVFVKDGKLIIKPTLQDAKLINENTIINLTETGICSSPKLSNCVTQTNLTTQEIIQPVKSGRINTRKGGVIRYGKVEVTAKLPKGDWLWPAIWMLPMNETYGPWPRSGEIDIVESRGNNYTYAQGGNNIASSALHWGPNAANDAWWRTNVKRKALHTTYASKEHVFGLEWSQKYVFTYIDTLLLQVLYTSFNEPLFKRGSFPHSDANGTLIADPWSSTARLSTPFDQDFYLIMNVGVGGTNGWFEDGVSEKPWVDHSASAKSDFWGAKDIWYPTWTAEGAGQMEVSKVEMWQQCDGNELY